MFSGAPRSNGLRFDVVGQVLTAMFRGQLKTGDRLVVKRLAEEFSVSATPAREALLELASLGAVELLPNKGAVVRPFGPQQIGEIYGVRCLLETAATRLACGKIPPQRLIELKQETQSLLDNPTAAKWSERAIQCDRELHLLIAQHSGQNYLAYEIERIGKLVKVARGLLGDIRQLQELAHHEHLHLIEALQAGNEIEAANAMSQHIQSARCVLVKESFFDSSVQQVDQVFSDCAMQVSFLPACEV